MSGGRPMSGSDPIRTLVARPESSRSKFTRWPCRRSRNSEPSSAPVASTYSLRSRSETTRPSPVSGSKVRTTPCTRAPESVPSGLLHLACLEAGGAHVDAARCAVDDGPNLLHVRVPASLRPPVRVAELHAEARLLAADLAHGCHERTLFLRRMGRDRPGRTHETSSAVTRVPSRARGTIPRNGCAHRGRRRGPGAARQGVPRRPPRAPGG